MSVLLAVATAEWQFMQATASVANIYRSRDDDLLERHSSRGDIARLQLYDHLMQSKHEWILFLDGDMQFPPETLQILLSHKKECVSGLYFRRQLNPVMPIAYEDDPAMRWPMLPLIDFPDEGLIKVGATGWGCFLIHKDVFNKVKTVLKGAPPIMDGALPEAWHGKKRIGADLRFGYYVRMVDIPIWLDCGLKVGHYMTTPISADHYRVSRSDIALAQYFFEVWRLRVGLMEPKELEFRLRGYTKELEGIKSELAKLENQRLALMEQAEQLKRQGDRKAGAIQELQSLINGPGPQDEN
jgi:hypothetical protein